MTFKEAIRKEPGDQVTFTGPAWHKIPESEQVSILEKRVDTNTKPRTVLFTVESPSLGRITRPHVEFQQPVLCMSTGGPDIDDIIDWALTGKQFD